MTDHLNEINTDSGCPKCGSPFVEKVKYTWWGGVIGPKILHHTKCVECKYRFNSKTREPNTKGIIIYSVIIFVVAFALFYFVATNR